MKSRRLFSKFLPIFYSLFWIFSCSAFWPFSCVDPSPTPSFLFFIIVASPVTNVPVGGQAMSMLAIGVYSDGTKGNITNLVKWSISDSTLGSIDQTGLFTSGATGGIVQVTATDPKSGITSQPYQLNVTGLITSVSTPTAPTDAYIRPSSTEVWVVSRVNGGGVYVIDSTSNTVTTTLAPPGGEIPGDLTFLPDGSKAYLSTTSGGEVYPINAVTKKFGTKLPTNTGAVNLAASPDGTSVFYCETVGSNSHATGVYKINTKKDTETLFDNQFLAPTGIVILGNGQLYVSDTGHGGGGYIYHYPSFTSPNGSSSFQLSNWVAGALSASNDGSSIFATGASSPPTYYFSTQSNSTPQVISSDYGKGVFFPDNHRVLWTQMVSGDFGIVDLSTSPPQLVDTISETPAGLAAMTPNAVLYLPSLSPNQVNVYQSY